MASVSSYFPTSQKLSPDIVAQDYSKHLEIEMETDRERKGNRYRETERDIHIEAEEMEGNRKIAREGKKEKEREDEDISLFLKSYKTQYITLPGTELRLEQGIQVMVKLFVRCLIMLITN